MHRGDTNPYYADQATRVVTRKKKSADEWLIAGFVAGGNPDHDVDVKMPSPLGTMKLNMRIAGSVYKVKLESGKPVATLVDLDAMHPTDAALDTD